jgi:hypothetical protein
LRCRSQLYGPFDEAGREPLTRRLSFSPHVETDRPRRGCGFGEDRHFLWQVKGRLRALGEIQAQILGSALLVGARSWVIFVGFFVYKARGGHVGTLRVVEKKA